jgi:SAM-dependent methyltransferase
MARAYHLDPVMAEHKRRVHLALLRRWCPLPRGARVLKTDLFEEALGGDEVLLSWPSSDEGARAYGIDISGEVCARARERIQQGRAEARVALADAGRLPFRDASLDFVFSCSTLDHFETRGEILRGLHEAARALKPGGSLLLTLDNPRALFYPLARLLERKGKIAFPLGETIPPQEIAEVLRECGLDVVARRGIYHVPRVVFTGGLRVLRALRLGFLSGGLLRFLALLEKGQGRRGEFRTAWYTAVLARRPV